MTQRHLLSFSLLVVCIGWPLAASAQVSCGDTIAARSRVVLTAPVGPCPQNAPVLILESGASLDLAGFTVSCIPAVGGFQEGIELIGKGAKLKNGVISGCNSPVTLSGEGRHRVESVVADGGRWAFSVFSDGNKVERSTALAPQNGGFWIAGDKNTVKDTLTTASAGVGYRILGSLNKLTGNVASGSATTGITISGDRNKVTGGSSTSSGSNGLEVAGGSQNRIKQVRVVGAVSQGIRVLVASVKTSVERCVALSNGLDIAVSNSQCGTQTFKKNVFGSSAAAGVNGAPCIR